MKGFDVLHVKSAVKTRNKFDLSRTHLTTMDFGEIVPLFVEETVPGDDITVHGNYFSRMAPLVKPTYGKVEFKTVAGFVPYHQLAYDADAWFGGKTTWEGITPQFRYFTIGDLAAFIRDYCTTTGDSATTVTLENADWTYKANNGNVVLCKFTQQGKYWVKILNALGYALPQACYYSTNSNWYTRVRLIKLSAFPLLAFFKLYNDYMSQSQRFNTSALSSLLLNIKNNIAVSSLYTSSGEILSMGLLQMFSNLYLNYGNDYFTSAWQNPNTPLSSVENVNSLDVPSPYHLSGVTIGQVPEDNIMTQRVQSDYINIGQRSLDFLKSFDSWVRRNNYAGSRAVAQVYARFGIKTDDYRTHYAHVLSTDSLPVQVGDVTSQASTDITKDGATKNIQLGDYAGKGIVAGDKGVSCKADDFGILIILGYFTVTPMNAFGFDRRVLRNTPLDYYNPEFDGLGAEAITVGEFYENPLASASGDTTNTDIVFGFTERYNSYRYGRDVITGEFRDYHPDGDMNCWHTGRNMNDIRRNGLVAQSTSVNTMPQINSEYNRIFSITEGPENHFYLTAHFNVDAIRPMMNLNQVPRLGEGDTAVPRNGNVIS